MSFDKETIDAALKYDFFFYKMKWREENSQPERIKKEKPEPCGKVIYKTKHDAVSAANGIEKNPMKGKQIRSIYYCKGCYGWHISRMSAKDLKR